MGEVKEFWKSVKGLICVCGTYRCGEKDCELVKYMNGEENKKQVREEDRTSTEEG